MDQDEFRKTYREVNERCCVFEKSVLTNQCECRQAERFCIAEREGVHCGSDEGQQRCLELLSLLREQARFALRSQSEEKGVLPHGKAVRVQVGGLRGLHVLLDPDEPVPENIPDVYGIIARAEQAYGSLEAIPYSELMPQIAAYQGRKRSRRQRKH